MHNIVIPISTETPAVNGPPQGQWTAADWENLSDEEKRYEIINGALYTQELPSTFHQWIIMQLYRLVDASHGDEIYTISRVAVIMSDQSITQPDFIGVLKSNAHIIPKWIYGVPDLVVEVISPGSKDYDEDVKKNAYEKAGVPEYALIDPTTRQLRLYAHNATGAYDEPRIFHSDDAVSFACLPNVSFAAQELFAGAPDTSL